MHQVDGLREDARLNGRLLVLAWGVHTICTADELEVTVAGIFGLSVPALESLMM